MYVYSHVNNNNNNELSIAHTHKIQINALYTIRIYILCVENEKKN